jgi:hypothetical protein
MDERGPANQGHVVVGLAHVLGRPGRQVGNTAGVADHVGEVGEGAQRRQRLVDLGVVKNEVWLGFGIHDRRPLLRLLKQVRG